MIKINDNNSIKEVTLYGKCKQDGTPTPDSPIDIVCNNGVIKIHKSLVIKSIPVANVDRSGVIVVGSSDTQTVHVAPVTPGVTYSVDAVQCYAFYTSEPSIGSVSYNNNRTVTTNTTFTVPNNSSIKYIAFRNAKLSGEIYQGEEAYVDGSIYTEGTQETITDNLGNNATAEMLLSVGNYKDTQKVVEGSVNRKVGIKVLNGSESWSAHATIPGWFQLPDSSVYPFISVALCTHYQYKETQGYTGIYFSIGRNSESGNSRIVIVDSKRFPNTGMLAEFKQYLADQYAAGTPVIIVYPLVTSTSESVTPQALYGSTVTKTAGSIPNMDFDVSHLFDLKERYIGSTEVKKVYNGSNLVHLHIKDNTKFMRRITCNDGIGEGVDVTGKIESINGTTLVWNQVVIIDNTFRRWAGLPLTSLSIENITNGFKITFLERGILRAYKRADLITNGHKCYVSADIMYAGAANIFLWLGGQTSNAVMINPTEKVEKFSFIGNVDNRDTDVYTYIVYGSSTQSFAVDDVFTIANMMCIDLTQMFGAGNEPSTVEEFEVMFPEAYYDYSEPTLLSFNPGIGSFQVNNMVNGDFTSDSEWDYPIGTTFTVANNHGTVTVNQAAQATISIAQSLSNTIKAGTYYIACKIKSSKTRNCSVSIGADHSTAEQIETNSSDFTIVDSIQTIESDLPASYFYISMNDSVEANEYIVVEEAKLVKIPDGITKAQARSVVYEGGTITQNPILRTTIGGEYHDTEFKISTLTGKLNGEGESVVIFPDGMKSAGSVYDEIVGNKAIKRIGSVDLGTLSWNKIQSYENVYSTPLDDSKNQTKNVISNYYTISPALTLSAFATNVDKSMYISNKGTANHRQLYVLDTSIQSTSSADIAAEMSGRILHYQKETYEEYILDDFQLPLSYQANGKGTEEILPSNPTTPTTTPANMVIDYRI